MRETPPTAVPCPPSSNTSVFPPAHQTLTFGDYRRPTILERCLLTLAAVGPVGWQAFHVLRKTRRAWSKVVVALVAPAVACIVRSFIAYFYRQVTHGSRLTSWMYMQAGSLCRKALVQIAQA